MADILTDGRPDGWTEALALEFVGASWPDHGLMDDAARVQFAFHFTHGDWQEIQTHYPEFQSWLNERNARNG